MSGIANIIKRDWRQEKEGTTLKQQVTGMWKKDDSSNRVSTHVSRPLSELKDPSQFGPPPRHVGIGGGVVPSTRVQPTPPARPGHTPSSTQSSQLPVEEPVAAPTPYRADTTGLSTAHLPPPPVRRGGADGRSPPPPPYTSPGKPTPPSLPPRLPPRATPGSPSGAPAPTTSQISDLRNHPGFLNQDAVNRLGNAGVKVSGFGIGKGNAPTPPQRSSGVSLPPPPRAGGSQLNELQSRFAKMGTPSQSPAPPSEGTTFAQKQAALQTAADFRKDPSSVSLSNAKSAASTFNNFRQRHGDQVAAGVESANSLNQKYGVGDRIRGYAGGNGTGAGEAARIASPTSVASAVGSIGTKNPAPPPPKKKTGLIGPGKPRLDADGEAPPPIPKSTRPQF